MRFLAPLATSLLGVRCSREFHFPASSALGLSQPYDGLLLQTASSFSFTRAPPVGFKVQRAINGDSCRSVQRSAKVHREIIPVWTAKQLDTQSSRSRLLRTHREHCCFQLSEKDLAFLATVNTSLTWLHARMKPGRRAHRQPERPHPTH